MANYTRTFDLQQGLGIPGITMLVFALNFILEKTVFVIRMSIFYALRQEDMVARFAGSKEMNQ